MHSPRTDTLKPYSACDDIRRWDFGDLIRIQRGHEAGAHHDWIRTLIIMTRELAPSAWLPIT